MKAKKWLHLICTLVLTLVLCFACACNDPGNNGEIPAPGTGTQDPSGGEKEPSGGEKDPSGSEKDPSGSEKDPSGSETDPSGSEKEPSGGETDPSDSEKDPSGSEKEPSGSEKDPSGSEKDPSGSETDPGTQQPSYPEWNGEWVSAIFGGGPFVEGGEKVLKDVTSSGFNTIMIWSVHVHGDGTLYLNDIMVCDNGKLVAKDEYLEFWAGLKGDHSSIERIELSVGAANCKDFEAIKDYIKKDGTGPETTLYKNMKLLIDATGADAVNYDDESCYDADSAIKFGQMCDDMGMKVSLCPYVGQGYWAKVVNGLKGIVDRVYLQCYAGGGMNLPGTWASWALSMGMRIIPGYWCGSDLGKDSASSVKDKLSRKTDYITGGFMWLYDDMQNLRSPNATKDYAKAINDANPHKEGEGAAQNFAREMKGALPKREER